ncbi:phosphoserine aminotransferase [Thraustotheca clavata]|uniref:phosphoglycerate dehydrogenase n=1 Tax=Thraustotheca clavata TaxID=74557 RepID=A0A1W0A3A1_9STRA|nr:phosphoserine aminotransferase [Thraustotheca clavata]
MWRLNRIKPSMALSRGASTKTRILVTDPIDSVGIDALRTYGYHVDVASLTPSQLLSEIPSYHGLVVRSNTRVNKEIIEAGKQLRVIARAGTGVDNIDLIAATKQSILVMNTPCGNTIGATELTMGLLTALARQHSISGVHGKTIGLIGLGRVGEQVAQRCLAFGMNVLAYDPLLSDKAAKARDIEPATLNELFARSDFISIHCPLTPGTRGILNKDRIARCKDGVFILNTSRKALLDLDAAYEAVESGKIQGLALDIVPSSEHPIFRHPNVLCTPHIGASTKEGQARVSLAISHQVDQALRGQSYSNIVNAPNLDLANNTVRPPYSLLAEKLGSLQAQLLSTQKITKVSISSQGKEVFAIPPNELRRAVCQGIGCHLLEHEITPENAVEILHSRGIVTDEHAQEDIEKDLNYNNVVTVACHLDDGTTRKVTGTVFGANQLRLIQYNKLNLDAILSGSMVFFTNTDKPGVLHAVTQVLAKHSINIGCFGLGRTENHAVGVLNVDDTPSSKVMEELGTMEQLANVRLVNLLDMPLALPSPLNVPAIKPKSMNFGSGPCKKRAGYTLGGLPSRTLGRSHRSTIGKKVLAEAIEKTKSILQLPDDYVCGIVPASDTGAFEMAMWNLLGPKPVDMFYWDAFGKGWQNDAVNELKLENVTTYSAPYGEIADLSKVNKDHDVCFTWNGTTSGVCVPNGDWIADDRTGLIMNDATSAAFAMEMPWNKIDVCTFSWQKVLGGEGAHGMLVMSPRALDRLNSFSPENRPLPKIFRMKNSKGEINMDLFKGSTINTPSMLCVEDYIDALDWAESQGGVPGLSAKASRNLAVIESFVEANDWIEFLAKDKSIRSKTSVCLMIPKASKAQLKEMQGILESNGVAVDIGSYKDAPPGLRIWCGATVETEDLEALMPWIDHAYHQAIED